jgi:ABC-type multidrug transport system fused ATPase/permease subunit
MCIAAQNSVTRPRSTTPSPASRPSTSKNEDSGVEPGGMDVDMEEPAEEPNHGNERHVEMQRLIETATPEVLEAKVADSNHLLSSLISSFKECGVDSQDNQHWVTQLSNLQNTKVNTPTVIGVVGNTGAGKSSVINALLEEERLVPTNCSKSAHSSHALRPSLTRISESLHGSRH